MQRAKRSSSKRSNHSVAVVSEGPPTYGVELSADGNSSLCIYQTEEKPAHLHLAFAAENREQVDAFYLAYLVVFGSLIAFSAYRFIVEQVSPALAATYAYVNPPIALLVGWWLGAETFSGYVLLGLPMVLSAVALLAWTRGDFRKGAFMHPAPRQPVSGDSVEGERSG